MMLAKASTAGSEKSMIFVGINQDDVVQMMSGKPQVYLGDKCPGILPDGTMIAVFYAQTNQRLADKLKEEISKTAQAADGTITIEERHA